MDVVGSREDKEEEESGGFVEEEVGSIMALNLIWFDVNVHFVDAPYCGLDMSCMTKNKSSYFVSKQ